MIVKEKLKELSSNAKMRLKKIKLKNLLYLILHVIIVERMDISHTHAPYEENSKIV